MDTLDRVGWTGHFELFAVRLVDLNRHCVDLLSTVLAGRTFLRPHVRLFTAGHRFSSFVDADSHLPDVLRQRDRRNRWLLFAVDIRPSGTCDREPKQVDPFVFVFFCSFEIILIKCWINSREKERSG